MQRELLRVVYPSIKRVDDRVFNNDKEKLDTSIEIALELINRCISQRETDKLMDVKNSIDNYLNEKEYSILGYRHSLEMELFQDANIVDVVECIEGILLHLDIIDKENEIHNYWLDWSKTYLEPWKDVYSVESIIDEVNHTFKLLSVCVNPSKKMVQQLLEAEHTFSLAEDKWCNSEARSEKEKEVEIFDYIDASLTYENTVKVLIDAVEILDSDVDDILRLYDDIKAVYKGEDDFRVVDILSCQRLLIVERILGLNAPKY